MYHKEQQADTQIGALIHPSSRPADTDWRAGALSGRSQIGVGDFAKLAA